MLPVTRSDNVRVESTLRTGWTRFVVRQQITSSVLRSDLGPVQMIIFTRTLSDISAARGCLAPISIAPEPVDINSCGGLHEMRLCNSQPCELDCQLTNWTAVGRCDAICGPGQQEYRRYVAQAASGNGSRCSGEVVKFMPCDAGPCQTPCTYSRWDLGPCNVSCGGGVRAMTRTATCIGCDSSTVARRCTETQATQLCNLQPCNNTCQTSEWTDWSDCNACDRGFQSRSRSIIKDYSGSGCPLLAANRCSRVRWGCMSRGMRLWRMDSNRPMQRGVQRGNSAYASKCSRSIQLLFDGGATCVQ